MKKIFTLFSILFLISTTYGLQTNQIDNFQAKENIRGLNIQEKSVFLTSKSHIQKLSNTDSWTQTPDGYLGAGIQVNQNYTVVGTRVGGKSVLLINRSTGKILKEKNLGNYVDRIGLYSISNSSFFAGGTLNKLEVFDANGTQVLNLGGGGYSWHPDSSSDLDNDEKKEIIVEGGGKPNNNNQAKLNVVDLQEGVLWKSDNKNYAKGVREDNQVIVSGKYSISAYSNTGQKKWSKTSEKILSHPSTSKEKMIYSAEEGLILRKTNSGELIKEIDYNTDITYLSSVPNRNLFAGVQSNNLSFFDLEGEKVHTKRIPGLSTKPDFGDYTGDGSQEVAVGAGDKVKIFDIKDGEPEVNGSLENYSFVGSGKEVLKAVALNQTVFVSDNFTKLNSTGELDGRFVGVGDVSGIESVEDFNSAFNISRKKYFVEDREKAVYVSALAAKDNASLTFERDKADRDFSNYTVEQLQDLFIEKFEPHHITITDLDSEKGLLSAYMAVKQGSLPINVPDKNKYNAVILNQKIQNTFNRIGENRKTVFQGKYISLLEAPEIQKSDPVEQGILGDPEDGNTYRTDLQYGNLDSDKYLEAGVGRYLEDTTTASKIFHRSMERKLGDKATVASEYLHASWPVVLSTGGGGLRYGSRMEKVFEEENYDTTHLVEYRANPVNFLLSLTPVEITSFLGEVEDIGDIVRKFVSDTAANAVENSLILIRVLNYTQQLMEMYFEFQWETYEFDFDRGMDRLEELDIDPTSTDSGDIQKTVMKLLYAFVWPERHPNLNQTSLTENMENSDILYYQGIGDQNKWVLPDNTTGYSGENRVEPEHVPRMEKTIVWDSSNLGAEGEMKEVLLQNGASSYLGYSSVNYPAYSSLTGYNFFRHRKTLGNSLKASINQMKTTDLIYSPTTIHKTGIREKMFDSLRLYGNPEMPKDPVNSENFETERNCEENICTLSISLDTPQKIVKHKGRKTVQSNSTNYLLEPGVSITALYSFSYRLPQNSEILETDTDLTSKRYENISIESYQPITSGGKAVNITERDIEIENSNLSINNDQVTFTVAGFKKKDNLTELVETAKAEIRYRSPVSIEADTENKTLEAEIYSENSFSGEILYRIGNRTSSRKVEVEKGRNSVNLENLSYGEKNVKIVLVNETVLAQTQETVRVGKPLEINFFSPEIRVGSTREVSAVVENPNSFPIKTELTLQPGKDLELGMLETSTRDIRIKAKRQRTLGWRILGVNSGEKNLYLNGRNHTVYVSDSMKSNSSISPGRFLKSLSSPTSDISVEVENGEVTAVWETVEGRISLEKTSNREKALLETEDFRVSKTVSTGKITEKLETSEGSYTKVTENGLTKRSGTLERETGEEKIELLEKEVLKLEDFLKRNFNQP